ncbi:MAG TPA: lipid-A-disaccharide synthase, partial [Thermodesulfobacteriota bacterium]|nr:lipid-A-disaccharide synthase [Thermodesulfobacteriota bacterium]
AGVDVTFVGHPLLDSVKSCFSRREALSYFGLTPGKPTIALLPGSRPSEIQMNFPALLKSVPLVVQQLETVQFIVPVAPGLDIDRILALTKPYDAWVHVIKGHVHDILNISELALVASGTATMETAIIGTPMIIVYRVSPITYLLGRLLIRTKNIGMVNIMAGKTIVPELIQSQCNPDRIAEAVLQLMQDPEKRHTIKQELASLRNSLGKPGASQRAAEVIHTFLKEDRLHARV